MAYVSGIMNPDFTLHLKKDKSAPDSPYNILDIMSVFKVAVCDDGEHKAAIFSRHRPGRAVKVIETPDEVVRKLLNMQKEITPGNLAVTFMQCLEGNDTSASFINTAYFLDTLPLDSNTSQIELKEHPSLTTLIARNSTMELQKNLRDAAKQAQTPSNTSLNMLKNDK